MRILIQSQENFTIPVFQGSETSEVVV